MCPVLGAGAGNLPGRINDLASWLELRSGLQVGIKGLSLLLAGLLLGIPLLGWLVSGQEVVAFFWFGIIFAGEMVLFLIAPYERKRLARKRLEEQLPEVLNILAEELKVGRSTELALSRVIEEIGQPSRQIFQTVLVDLMLSGGRRSLEDLLLEQAHHPDLKSGDLELAATALKIITPLGGDMALLFSKMSDVIRDKQLLEAQIANYTLLGRGSGIMISIITFLIFTAILLAPTFRDQLLGSYGGRLIFGLSILFYIIALRLFWRLISIRF